MNLSKIEVIHLPTGYAAYYTAAFKTGRVEVKDAEGNPARFGTYDKAKIAAYDALYAEENKIFAMRHDPSQVKETPTVWQAVRPKSLAGKRAVAERLFKVREAAE
jgi:hypothetical protein